MSKYERIRRLCIIIGSLMVVVGAFKMLTRGNPLDESIGYVGVSNGSRIISVDGYKYSYNFDDEQSKLDSFVTIENAEVIPEIDYLINDEHCNLSVSFTDESTGKPSYAVYNESFECIIESQPDLEMPAELDKKYYIEVSVDWGDKDNNVTVKYYFAVNIKE